MTTKVKNPPKQEYYSFNDELFNNNSFLDTKKYRVVL